MRIYKVHIDWERKDFLVEHYKTLADSSPAPEIAHHPDEAMSNSMFSGACLSHLELISPGPDSRSKEILPPVLLALYCNLPSQDDQQPAQEAPSTIIVRWELSSIKPVLHSNFAQLMPKSVSADLPVCWQARDIY